MLTSEKATMKYWKDHFVAKEADLLHKVLWICTKSVALQLWAAASPSLRILLKMQILRPQPKLTESETLGKGLFSQALQVFQIHINLEKQWILSVEGLNPWKPFVFGQIT